MFKKTITYKDFDGNERTEDFYFHLSRTEITKLELSEKGGLTALIDKVIQSQNLTEVIRIFEELISKAYGEKSLDGRQFMKYNDAGVPLFKSFAETNAYDQLYMELATNDKAAAEFVNGIIPNDVDMSIENVNNLHTVK